MSTAHGQLPSTPLPSAQIHCKKDFPWLLGKSREARKFREKSRTTEMRSPPGFGEKCFDGGDLHVWDE